MDVERTMEFLLEQHARLLEQSAQHDSRLTRIENILVDIAQSHERTNEIVAVLAQRLVDFNQSQERTNETVAQQLADLAQKLDGFAQSQERTNQAVAQKLADLVDLMERHITGHN